MNQTLSRTIITSGTVLLSVLVLFIFAGPAIRGFAFAVFAGILIGT
jgi:preprotein translocase subunit SecF